VVVSGTGGQLCHLTDRMLAVFGALVHEEYARYHGPWGGFFQACDKACDKAYSS
jgi:hypothetical protein